MLHRPLWWLTVGPVINGIGIPLLTNAEKDAVGAGCWWKDHLLRNDLMKHSVAQLPKISSFLLGLFHEVCLLFVSPSSTVSALPPRPDPLLSAIGQEV